MTTHPCTGQASDSAHLPNERIRLVNLMKGKVRITYGTHIIFAMCHIARLQDVLKELLKGLPVAAGRGRADSSFDDSGPLSPAKV